MRIDLILLVAVVVVGLATLIVLERARRAAKRRGSIVVCVDRSGSMYGPLADWCAVLALELLHEARARKRDFHVLYFNHEGANFHHQYAPRGEGQLKAPPEPNGGTRYEPVLREALTMCDEGSNIVFITDGVGEPDPQMPSHDGIDLRLDAVELMFGRDWPIPFADVTHEVDGRNLPHPPDLVRKIARRF
jgi:hypothetical protein